MRTEKYLHKWKVSKGAGPNIVYFILYFNNKCSWNITTWNDTISMDMNNHDKDYNYNLSTTTIIIKQLDR